MTVKSRRPVSRNDVARVAGVSPVTVSLVLNGRANALRISEETQRRVLDAARELHYVPNPAARAMVRRRHQAIGLVLPWPPDRRTLHVPMFEDMIVAVIQEAAERGYHVIVLPPVDSRPDYDVIGVLKDTQVDGIVVIELRWVAEELSRWNIPVVFIDPDFDRDDPITLPCSVVVAERNPGMDGVIDLLLRGEWRSVIAISGLSRDGQWVPRIRALDRGLGSLYEIRHQVAANWSLASGYRAMKAVLPSIVCPAAVFIAADYLATGAMSAVHEAGLAMPDDVSVIGFGDVPIAAYLHPRLTTVRWPLHEVGARAVELLIAGLDRQEDEPGHERLATTFIERDSVAVKRRDASG